jgi:hypothetical protein
MMRTTNMSKAAMSGAWLGRKVRHSWDRGPESPDHVPREAGLSDRKAELEQSPWMRGAPQSRSQRSSAGSAPAGSHLFLDALRGARDGHRYDGTSKLDTPQRVSVEKGAQITVLYDDGNPQPQRMADGRTRQCA